MYIYIYMYMCVYVYIYIYREIAAARKFGSVDAAFMNMSAETSCTHGAGRRYCRVDS